MNKLCTLIIFIAIIGCNGISSNREIQKDTLKKDALSESFNSNDYDTFSNKDSVYAFKVPKGLFKQLSDNTFECQKFNAKITFISNATFWSDENVQNGTEDLYTKADLIKKFKKKVANPYVVDKDNWFVISGVNYNNKILYSKGFYEAFSSMQGRDEGEPMWLWSKYGLLEIEYDQIFRKEFDIIIPTIIKSFTCDVVLL
jgi:hypothetical protein